MGQLFQGDEVKKGVFNMVGMKAPGPDGMPALFYQRYWEVVGADVIEMVLETLNHGSSLCYKQYSECFCGGTPHYEQYSYEVHYVIKKKRGSQKGWVSLKLDMEKAYDRVE
ncbi:hypothetical protein LIER_41708 [Lithospermum erythrorhizon]|uniref:Reverse transcriptase n=1 Tax=Lithospermum erythrorhizon TaxID=34254 RepID=A0AAV3RH60_LITER